VPARTPRRIGLFFALGVAALLACSDGTQRNNFREDVIECEDALDRLTRCCPGFDAQPVMCQFYYSKQDGCGTTTIDAVNPALTTDESACIRSKSCEELVSAKVCDRAQAARTYEHHETTSDTPSSTPPTVNDQSHAPVCP
jgi:hypothetical protein